MSYNLLLRGDHVLLGREAEAMCKTLGIPKTNNLSFYFSGRFLLLENEIDRIVPFGYCDYELVINRNELHLLKEYDFYHKDSYENPGRINVSAGTNGRKAIALYDRVMAFRKSQRNSNLIMVEFSEDQLKAVLEVVGNKVSSQPNPESGLLYQAERLLDSALFVYERSFDTNG